MNSRLLIVLLLCPFSSFTQASWQTLTDPDERFVIDMFGEIRGSSDTSSRNDTLLISHVFESEVKDRGHANSYYVFSISSYPSNVIHSDSSFQKIDLYLNASAPRLKNEEGVAFLHSSYESREGYPGKVFKYSYTQDSAKVQLVYRSFLIQNHLVQLGTISRADRWHNLSASRFFDSFSLKNISSNDRDYGLEPSEERSFAIDFPEEAKKQTRYLDSRIGKIAIQINILERSVPLGNKVFIATETSYPEGFVVEDEQLESFYDESIAGSLSNSNARLLSKKKLTIEGREGVSYATSMFDGQMRGYYRSLYVDKCLYTFGVLTSMKGLDEEAQKFFGSFRLDP